MEEQANETINMDFPNVPTPESRSATPIPPALPPRADKRILLLVYIHGFKGNETSFRELPMDLQEHLQPKLFRHTLYTHIYPKYKTKRAFSIATVNFCEWLRNTIRSYNRTLDTIDVILLGHSMGGSLASEAIILLSRITFKHNISGIIGLDSPFLGVHPHVVASGVAGLVKPVTPTKVTVHLDRPTGETDSASTSTLSIPDTLMYSESNSSQSSVDLPRLRTPSPAPQPENEEKKSNFKKTFTKTVTTIYKHRHELGSAGPRYLWSHLEYGHILLDPAELKEQYDQLRKLPIKFVNYYTTIPRKNSEKRDRVFCSLPESVGRSMDGWEEIEMEPEMDEPTAHSAIFAKDYFRGYWDLIERIAEKISSWE